MAANVQTRETNKHDQLLDRIHQMECKEAIILKESHELREQNELLEFRIIELEEGADKVRVYALFFIIIIIFRLLVELRQFFHAFFSCCESQRVDVDVDAGF